MIEITDEDVTRFEDALERAYGIIAVPEEKSPAEVREALQAAVPPIVARELATPVRLTEQAIRLAGTSTYTMEACLQSLLTAAGVYAERARMRYLLERLAPAEGVPAFNAYEEQVCPFCRTETSAEIRHEPGCPWTAARRFLEERQAYEKPAITPSRPPAAEQHMIQGL